MLLWLILTLPLRPTSSRPALECDGPTVIASDKA